MKQKIKKVAYAIPLHGESGIKGKIIVESFDLSSIKDKKSQRAVTIAVELEPQDEYSEPIQWKVGVPKKQVKELRKVLKKVCK